MAKSCATVLAGELWLVDVLEMLAGEIRPGSCGECSHWDTC